MVRQGEESETTFYCRNRHDLLPYRSVVFTEKDGQHAQGLLQYRHAVNHITSCLTVLSVIAIFNITFDQSRHFVITLRNTSLIYDIKVCLQLFRNMPSYLSKRELR